MRQIETPRIYIGRSAIDTSSNETIYDSMLQAYIDGGIYIDHIDFTTGACYVKDDVNISKLDSTLDTTDSSEYIPTLITALTVLFTITTALI